MRWASRIVGALLVVGGLGPFAIVAYVSFTEGWAGATRQTWLVFAVFLAAGLGLMLAGRYYLRLDPDVPDAIKPTSPLTHFLIKHRRELRVLAEAGLAFTVVRLVSACFQIDWPGRWADWLIIFGALSLMYCGRKMADPKVADNDWMKVPSWIRNSLPLVSNVVLSGAFLLILVEQLVERRSQPYHWVLRALFPRLPGCPVRRCSAIFSIWRVAADRRRRRLDRKCRVSTCLSLKISPGSRLRCVEP